jgi:hypothetical protein
MCVNARKIISIDTAITKGNEMNAKIAAYVGNKHAKARVTPFFDTHEEARKVAIQAGHLEAFTQECANWQEHQRWNSERVGMYASMPVQE